METIEIKVGEKIYEVSLAKTSEEKEKGLMGVKELDSDKGMLFDYSDDPQPEIAFWMKDTIIPLDIVFINSSNIVSAIAPGEPESENIIAGIADEGELLSYVLEVNQNSGIQVGDIFAIVEADDFEGVEDVSDDEIKMFILDSNGNPVHEIEAGVRLFSRIHTRELIRLVKHANKTNEDKDYKKVAKRLFKILDIQNNQEPEYVNSPQGEEIEKYENV